MDTFALVWAMLQLLAAVLCLLAAASDAMHRSAGGAALWRLFAALQLMLLANTLVRADLAVVGSLREWARQESWYAMRRPLQAGVLVLLGWLGVRALQGLRAQLARLASPAPARLGLLGSSVLLGLLGLRLVSFHYTDALLHWRLPGLSLGRGLELLALGLLLLAAARQLRNAWTPLGKRHV